MGLKYRLENIYETTIMHKGYTLVPGEPKDNVPEKNVYPAFKNLENKKMVKVTDMRDVRKDNKLEKALENNSVANELKSIENDIKDNNTDLGEKIPEVSVYDDSKDVNPEEAASEDAPKVSVEPVVEEIVEEIVEEVSIEQQEDKPELNPEEKVQENKTASKNSSKKAKKAKKNNK